MLNPGFSVLPIPGMPMVMPGDDLCGQILTAITEADVQLVDGDVICIAQKVVSKAENRLIDIASVTPSEEAIVLAEEMNWKNLKQIWKIENKKQ